MRNLNSFFIFLLLSNFAYAANVDCSKKANSLEIVACHENRYVEADKKLNSVYSSAMKNINENQKKALKQSQLAWLKFRDSNFTFVIEMNKDGGSFANVAIAEFKATFVEKRVAELKDLFVGPSGEAPDWVK